MTDLSLLASLDVDEDNMRRLAAALASLLANGDVVALAGGLGAGKSTFVRALIQEAHGYGVDVPSPTFTLVQTYKPQRGPDIWHADLYRLEHHSELEEIGLEEAIEHGVLIVEWPEKLPDDWIATALTLHLSHAQPGMRRMDIYGDPAWRARLEGRWP